MRHWRTAFAVVLTLGLVSMPFPAHAQEEEGSMSGQEAPDMQGKQVPSGAYTITGVLHYESPYQTTRRASKTINIISPDFQLTVNPASHSISKGSSGVFTITITSLNGFTSTVNLSARILPLVKHPPTLSPIASMTLTSTNPTGTTTLTVSTNRSTNAGTYTITTTGTSGTTTHSISATVTVTNK